MISRRTRFTASRGLENTCDAFRLNGLLGARNYSRERESKKKINLLIVENLGTETLIILFSTREERPQRFRSLRSVKRIGKKIFHREQLVVDLNMIHDICNTCTPRYSKSDLPRTMIVGRMLEHTL